MTANSTPTNIVSGRDGRIWFLERTGNKMGRINPGSPGDGITEFPVPSASSWPYDLVLGPDGNIWFTEYTAGKVARIDLSGNIKEYPLPSGSGSGPRGITVGLDGHIWVVENTANKIARIQIHVPGDANADGAVNVTDVLYLINFLFAGGPPPAY